MGASSLGSCGGCILGRNGVKLAGRIEGGTEVDAAVGAALSGLPSLRVLFLLLPPIPPLRCTVGAPRGIESLAGGRGRMAEVDSQSNAI